MGNYADLVAGSSLIFCCLPFNPLSSCFLPVRETQERLARMVASAVYVMDFKGKIIISRNYRGDIPTSCAEVFSHRIAEMEESELKPIFTVDGVTYVYIKVCMANMDSRYCRAETVEWMSNCVQILDILASSFTN